MGRFEQRIGERIERGRRTIPQPPPVAPNAIVLDDFEEGFIRKHSATGNDIWVPWGPGSNVSIEYFEGSNRLKLYTTDYASPAWGVRSRCIFDTNSYIGGQRYRYPDCFVISQLKDSDPPGSPPSNWSGTINRLEFWMHHDRTVEWGDRLNLDIGNYLKPYVPGTPPDDQGNHWYHLLGGKVWAGEWIKHCVLWSPQANNYYCVSHGANQTYYGEPCARLSPPDNHWTSQTHFYINFQGGDIPTAQDPHTYYFDDFVFSEDSYKDLAGRIRTASITYNGTAYQVNISGPTDESNIFIDINRGSQSMLTNGWSSGSLFGTVQSTGTVYTQIQYTGPPEARSGSTIYFAFKVQGDPDTNIIEVSFPPYGQP